MDCVPLFRLRVLVAFYEDSVVISFLVEITPEYRIKIKQETDALTRNGFRASCSIHSLLLFCLGKVRISSFKGKEEIEVESVAVSNRDCVGV